MWQPNPREKEESHPINKDLTSLKNNKKFQIPLLDSAKVKEKEKLKKKNSNLKNLKRKGGNFEIWI